MMGTSLLTPRPTCTPQYMPCPQHCGDGARQFISVLISASCCPLLDVLGGRRAARPPSPVPRLAGERGWPDVPGVAGTLWA